MSREARIVAAILLVVLVTAVVYSVMRATDQGTALSQSLNNVALPDGSEAPLNAALDDLSAKLGLNRNAIEILSVEEHTWNDTSLGCPQPGKMYAQVMTPGFLIRLKAGDETYEYHASKNTAVLCEKR